MTDVINILNQLKAELHKQGMDNLLQNEDLQKLIAHIAPKLNASVNAKSGISAGIGVGVGAGLGAGVGIGLGAQQDKTMQGALLGAGAGALMGWLLHDAFTGTGGKRGSQDSSIAKVNDEQAQSNEFDRVEVLLSPTGNNSEV